MILRYFHQQLNEIRQKMEILIGQKEAEIKQVQQVNLILINILNVSLFKTRNPIHLLL